MSQSRIPVFTTSKREEDHVLPACFYAGEGRVSDVCALGIDRSITGRWLTIVDLIRIKDVRDRAQTSTEATHVIEGAVRGETDVSCDGEVFDTLVDVGHHISIERGVIPLAVGVVTKLRAGKERSRRCIALAFIEAIDHVGTCTTRDINPVIDLPLERTIDHIAVLATHGQHAISHPVRVLLRISITVVPVLHIDLTRRVINLIGTYPIEVLPTREEIKRNNRVEIFTLSDQILVPLTDIVEAEVQRQLIFEELSRVAEAEVVAVVLAVGDDTSCISRTKREVRLILSVTNGERSSILDVRTRIKEVSRIERTIRRSRLRTPALHITRGIDELILEARHHEGTREGGAIREHHLHTTILTLLRGDHDDPLSCTCPIESCCSRTTEDTNRLDVIRVDIRDPFTLRL